MKKRIISIILCITMVMTILVGLNLTVNAASGDYTGLAGFTVHAYPDGVRMNMIPVTGATDYKVYMSTDSMLTIANVNTAPCIFSSSSYQPYAYFANGEKDKVVTTTAVTINAGNTYYFYYVTDDTTITTKYEAHTQAGGTSWTGAGNYDTSWYTGGGPYTISTAAQLAGLAYLVNNGTENFTGKTVNLSTSVDVSAYPWTAIGTQANPFTGTFDGQSNVVNGIYLNATSDYQGLFGNASGGTIENLGVVNGFVRSTGGQVGGVVGIADTLQNCYSTGNVVSIGVGSVCVGGVAGYANVSIQDCYNTGSVMDTGDSSQAVGGVAGYAESIQSCYNTGVVTDTGAGSRLVGGVVGEAYNTIQNCYNTGSVMDNGDNSHSIGGVCGGVLASIQDSYNTGNVTDTGDNCYEVGGVVGIANLTVQKCYNIGTVTSGTGSTEVGGVTGYVDTVDNGVNAYIKNSYAACTVTTGGPAVTNKIYYNSVGSTNVVNGNGTFIDEADCFTKIDSANFCTAPTQYAIGGVFSALNPVNNGYPVLKAFGYTGDDASIDTEFSISGSTYTVANAYQMDLMRNYLGSSYETQIFQMAGNIDISPTQYNQTITGGADGTDSWQPIGAGGPEFYATFDGAGFSICGLYIHSTNSFQGLFGLIAKDVDGGVIENLGVSGSILDTDGSSQAVGSVVGAAFTNATVQNCNNTGSVMSSGGYVGGIAGCGNSGATIRDCDNVGSVSSEGNNIGGIVGYAFNNAMVQNCNNTGNLTSTGTYIGGIAGNSNLGATIQNCNNTGSVMNEGGLAGGIVGSIGATVQNCSNIGGVASSGSQVGGVVGGGNPGSAIQNCSNIGSVKGEADSVGGVVGATNGTVQNCFNTGYVTAVGNGVGGVAGGIGGSIQKCFNTGSVTDTGASSACIGGVVGYGITVQTCYNTGTVIATGGGNTYVGGVAGSIMGTIQNCYYCGYSGGIGNGGDNTASDTAGQAQIFTKLASASIQKGNATTVTENNASVLNGAANLGADFAVSFGAYVSSNVSVASVAGTTVTGVAAGSANITSTITLTQNNLNMVSTIPVWTGTTRTFTAQITMPLTVTAPAYAPVIQNGTAPTITTASLLDGTVGTIYSQTLTATGTAPMTWNITAGSLPTGLSMSGTGVLSGTPTAVGTSTFTVKALNSYGSDTKTYTVTVTEGSGSTVLPTNVSTASPTSPGVDIIVNKDTVNAGTASNSNEGGKTVTTITVDQQKLEQKLVTEGSNALVIVPINSNSDKLIGQLNGQMVKDMEDKQATLEIKTTSTTYTLPVSEINIGAVSAQLGTNVTLSDINVQVSIASPSDQTVTIVKSAAASGGFSVTVPAVDFNISCTCNGKTVDVSTFNVYVERTVAIPDGVDPAKITTGVVVSQNGTVRHVPTKVTIIDDKYYAVINSLTNSTYTVIWHPIEFTDVMTNWAKDSINDMGSRMVVTGVGNNNYTPDRDITRAEFAAIIVRALGLAPGDGTTSFKDVSNSNWYCSYIQTAAVYGIVYGYDATVFGPNDKITREQAMMMIARAMKITRLNSSLTDGEVSALLKSFTDSVNVSAYAKSSIAACIKTGIVFGRSHSTMAPTGYITRAEVAVIVERLLQKSNLI